MRKASEYRQHAKECRSLAGHAISEEHRKQLLAMAESWDTLASEREKTALKGDIKLAPMSSRGSGSNESGTNGSGTNGSGGGHAAY